MTEYYFYKTGYLDRWDTLAYKFYGNCCKTQPIIAANPHIAISPVIDEGIVLRIPVVEAASIDTSVLPVWKQA